jgi:hypothetical protein
MTYQTPAAPKTQATSSGRCGLLTSLRAPQDHMLPIGDSSPRLSPKPAFHHFPAATDDDMDAGAKSHGREVDLMALPASC